MAIEGDTLTLKDGRTLVVRELNPAERLDMLATVVPANLAGNQQVIGHITVAMMVRAIDGSEITLPAKYSEAKFVLQRLGNDGFNAVVGYLEARLSAENSDEAIAKN